MRLFTGALDNDVNWKKREEMCSSLVNLSDYFEKLAKWVGVESPWQLTGVKTDRDSLVVLMTSS